MICLPKNVAPFMGLASKDEGRYSMCGVLVEEKQGDAFRLFATDGKKLGVIQGPSAGALLDEFSPDDSAKYLVPTKALENAFKDAGKDGTVRLSCREKIVSLSAGSASRTEGEIEGRFPDYPLVLPAGEPVAVATV